MQTTATINYAARTDFRPRYFANDHSGDTVVIAPLPMPMIDGRASPGNLDTQGFALVPHVSAITDFVAMGEAAPRYAEEIRALLLEHSGADEVLITAPGIVRFSERSPAAGTLDNSMPARFAHIDITPETAAGFVAGSVPDASSLRRYANFNVWRCFSGAPQDVALAVCDAQSVAPEDLIEADAIFDQPGRPDWSFVAHIVAHNPAHRWHWFADMTRDEALIFKTSDSALGNAVPHVAFDNPHAPTDCHPRASIEMRALAIWR